MPAEPAPITIAVRKHSAASIREAAVAIEGFFQVPQRHSAIATCAVSAYIQTAQRGELTDDLDDALRFALTRAAGDPHKLVELLDRIGLAIVPKAVVR